ncbi:uncharacterized protein LOC141599508 [Silene latifolia]|uniref:uncharacterized protein LOC141599508 n=1 Tax=Silene latifolia TaxID=37657 RepID=UPI003D7792D0
MKKKKIFFFLACLSPLDSAVSIDDLMRYGIGLDLFQRVNNVLEAKEQATGWANELVSSSLLLSDESNGQVRIHDVVRASAIMFAEKGKDRMTLVESIPRWMCEETLAKFTAMSLLSGHDFSCLSGVKAPLLEILLLKGDVSLTSLASDFFGGMTNLKVLSLSNMNFKLGLPESMGQLERLKTLHLHHCQLKDIKIIGRLVNLLVLSLRESSLEELANEVGELCKLRLLDMGGCKGRISIPANILSRLSRLEGLYMFNSFNDWAYMNTEANDGEVDNKAHLAELNKLSHLTVLEMEVPKSEQIQMLHDSQLVEQLGKFKIHVGGFNKWGMDTSQSFLCSLKLENIDTSRNNCLKALLKKIDCLQAIGCGNLTENIVPQWDEEGFQDLHSLDLKYCEYVKFIISSSKQNEFMAFANLKFLRLYAMKNLEMICNGKIPAGIFSNIQHLILMSLPKLMYGLPLTILPLNLAEVDIYDCESLKFIVIDDPFVSSEKVVVQETYNVGLHLLKSLKLDKVASLSSVLGGAETFDEGAQANQPFFHAKIIFPLLETLRLTSNNKTTTLWSKACHVSGFQNLKLVDICFCAELESLGSPSIFATLVQLEELSVRHCKKLQQVITKETQVDEVREHAITFSLLKQLSMGGLSNLERFYGGTYKLEFPLLKSLTFSDFHSMMAFDGSENSTALFSDQIEFPCLEELNVQNVSNQVVSLWNWCTSDVQGKSGSEIISINPVPKLQKLTLGQTRGLASIPPFISHNLTHLLVVQFCDIKILFSTVTTSSEVLWTYSQLVKLEDLSIDGCDSLEELFENEDDDGAISLCGRLSSLMLSNVPKLNMIPLHLLTNLRSLCLSDLSWTYTFTADLFIRGREQLQLLQSLEIIGCQNMKVVLMDELVGDGADRVYVFPHLKNLILEELGITNFASKPNTALHFPSLEKVQLMRCNKMRSFCSGPFIAPKLEKLQILYCRKVKYFLSEKMKDFQELPSLESVNIESCPMLLSILSVPLSAPRLSEVNLKGCRKMKWFALGNPKHDDILELPFLEAVFIDSCSSMKSFSPGGIKAPELSELQIDESDYSKRANEELEHLLGNLYLCPTRDEDEYMDDEDEYTEDEDMDDELWNESNEGSEEEQIEEIMRA